MLLLRFDLVPLAAHVLLLLFAFIICLLKSGPARSPLRHTHCNGSRQLPIRLRRLFRRPAPEGQGR